MRKLIAWTLLVCTLLLCGCAKEKISEEPTTEAATTDAPTTPTTEQASQEPTAEKANFGALPENYTPEQALEHQCLVLVWGEDATQPPEVLGREHWESFLTACENGQTDARLRVIYFQGEVYYYSDLTRYDGYYSMYTYNAFHNYEAAIGAYRYMKRIEGIEPNTNNHVCYYILTDLEELTSEDVLSAARICDIETEKGVPYEPVDFTQYLYLD
ncbi:MAG: hypothetical protein E7467_07605 [Ruminococcaceae bacterium]|nr:hypothetical protein [Oscillospiraceae bacterium]